MKQLVFALLFSTILFSQDEIIEVRGHQLKLGMNIDDVWNLLSSDFNVIEDDDGNFFVSDNMDAPVCVVYFKDEKVVKIIKDWGTTYKTNAGQVFKLLWNILKEHEADLNSVKIIPQQSFSASGDKNDILIYLKENRYLEITIRFNVTILEVLEEAQP